MQRLWRPRLHAFRVSAVLCGRSGGAGEEEVGLWSLRGGEVEWRSMDEIVGLSGIEVGG